MSDNRKLPRTADEVGEFMNNLVFEELPTAQDEADTLASLPAGSEVIAVRSLPELRAYPGSRSPTAA